MGEFASLEAALDGRFEKPLAELSGELRQRVEKDLFPMPWDRLSADQRRIVARQWDYQNDPATELDRQEWWDRSVEKRSVEQQIEEWQSTPAATISELALKKQRLVELQRALDAINERFKTGRPEQETGGERRDRLSKDVNAQRASGKRAFLKTVAANEGISVSRLKQILAPAQKKTAEYRMVSPS